MSCPRAARPGVRDELEMAQEQLVHRHSSHDQDHLVEFHFLGLSQIDILKSGCDPVLPGFETQQSAVRYDTHPLTNEVAHVDRVVLTAYGQPCHTIRSGYRERG